MMHAARRKQLQRIPCSKVYSYITTDDNYGYDNCNDNSCVATYSFELFSEIGTDVNFRDSDYNGVINENFVIVIDFIDTEIKENINNINISIKLDSTEIWENRNTLVSSLKNFSVIADDCDATLDFNSNFKECNRLHTYLS